jgi:hypothetical protein
VGYIDSTLQENRGSAVVERYSALLRAVEGRAALLGAETKLAHVPKSHSEPFVLDYKNGSSSQTGLIFVYRPDMLILTSEAISFLAGRILSAEGDGHSITILLPSESFNAVQNVLRVTNLIAHAAIAPYDKDGQVYTMSWLLPQA